MKINKLIYIFIASASLVACDGKQPQKEDSAITAVRIFPLMTKATDVDFEQGDKIGVNIVREGSKWVENKQMTFEDGVFSSDLCWYAEAEDSCSIFAVYPYNAEGIPSKFSVQEDQSAGVTSSDLMFALKRGVYPSFNKVDMVFTHSLCLVSITVANLSKETIESVSLGGIVPDADINLDNQTVQVSSSSETVEIKTLGVKGDTLWRAIVVPQTAQIQFNVKLSSGKVLSQKLKEMSLERSTCYSISAVVYNNDVKIVTSAAIQPWLDGGDIQALEEESPEEPEFEEFDDHFIYDGVSYKTVDMKDGKRWMAQNLRYVPANTAISSNLTDTLASMFYPLVVNADNTALEFSSSDAVIAAGGYLYRLEFALGQKVRSVKDEATAKSLEGVRGICPEGWHIPTLDDIMNLTGKSAQQEDRTGAPYYKDGNGKLDLLNADGMNMHAYGAVSIVIVSGTQSIKQTMMGWLKSNPSAISTGFFAGSTLKSMTFYPDQRVKQAMLTGFMPFETNGTCNGSGINLWGAYPVRCVKD